jgi:hypothetical protein
LPAASHASPLNRRKGAIVIPDTLAIGLAIEELVTIIECSEQHEWENLVIYLPI